MAAFGFTINAAVGSVYNPYMASSPFAYSYYLFIITLAIVGFLFAALGLIHVLRASRNKA